MHKQKTPQNAALRSAQVGKYYHFFNISFSGWHTVVPDTQKVILGNLNPPPKKTNAKKKAWPPMGGDHKQTRSQKNSKRTKIVSFYNKFVLR